MEFVYPCFKRKRGWPWPEDSWGLDPMFGAAGWCHGCGTPHGPQIGVLVLRRASLTVRGAWMPNWRFDTICLEDSLAASLSQKFRLDLRDVEWPKDGPPAKQMVIPTVGQAWFDPRELEVKATERHGSAGAACSTCGRWRWMPLPWDQLPPVKPSAAWDGLDAVASPEWFGAGKQSYRQILVSESLAEDLVAASPRELTIQRAQ